MRHSLTLIAAIIFFVSLSMLGTFLELILLQSDYGLGISLSWLFFVFAWYGVIRANKPVWQPGRRFWVRWVWISVSSIVVEALDITATAVFASSFVILSVLWLLIDAVKNFKDVSLTKNTKNPTTSQA